MLKMLVPFLVEKNERPIEARGIISQPVYLNLYMSGNTRRGFLELTIWMVIAALFYLAFAVDLGAYYGLIRAIGIVALFAVIHYGNSYIFWRTIPEKRYSLYMVCVGCLVVVTVLMRYPLEVLVFPEQAHPRGFRVVLFRPAFYLFSNALMAALSTVVLYINLLAEKERHLLQTISSHNEARLQQLQSHIHPHFLFNTLNNIYSLMLIDAAKAPAMLLRLTEMLRYSVYQGQFVRVSVGEEAQQIEFLIELFSMKRDEPYPIVFRKAIDGGMIEPMILIPIAENCLKHCDFELNDAAFAEMELVSDQSTIRFTTKNTFTPRAEKPATGGVGLKNIRERLELVYGGRFTLDISEDNNIFKLQLELKWKK